MERGKSKKFSSLAAAARALGRKSLDSEEEK